MNHWIVSFEIKDFFVWMGFCFTLMVLVDVTKYIWQRAMASRASKKRRSKVMCSVCEKIFYEERNRVEGEM